MKTINRLKFLMGVMTLLLALAACKQSGEQATAPQATDTEQEAYLAALRDLGASITE